MTQDEVRGFMAGLGAAARLPGLAEPQYWAIKAMICRASAWRWAMVAASGPSDLTSTASRWSDEDAASAAEYDAEADAAVVR